MDLEDRDSIREYDYKGGSRLVGNDLEIETRFSTEEPKVPIALIFKDEELEINAQYTRTSPKYDFTERKERFFPRNSGDLPMSDSLMESLRLHLIDLYYYKHLGYHEESNRMEIKMAKSDKVLSSEDETDPRLLSFHYYTLSPVLITAIEAELGIEGLREFVDLIEKYSKYKEEESDSKEEEIYNVNKKTLNGIYDQAKQSTEELFKRLAGYQNGDRFTIDFNNGLPTIQYYRLGNLDNGEDWYLPLESAYALISILKDFPTTGFDYFDEIVILELHDYELSISMDGYHSQLRNQFGFLGRYHNNFILLPMSGNVVEDEGENVLVSDVSQCAQTIWHEIFHLVASKSRKRLHIGTEEGLATAYGEGFDEDWFIRNLSVYINSTEDLIPQFNYLYGCDIIEVLTEMQKSFPEFNAEKFLMELKGKIDGYLTSQEET